MKKKKGKNEKMRSIDKEKKRYFSVVAIRSVFIIAGIFLWEYSASSGSYNPIFTSYPSQILKDLIVFFTSGELYKHASITLTEVFWGLFFGSAIGILLAIVFGYFSFIGEIITPIISAISCIPQLALAPVYVLWFGLGLTSKIFLAGLMVFFNVFSATYGAIKSMDKGILESANLLGASHFQTLRTVVIPSCMPWILSGLRGGVSAALVGAIIGEYIGSKGGFGWMITYSTSYFNISRVMSCIVILLFVGLGLNKILDIMEQKLLVWRTVTSLRMENLKNQD
ncbi:ABC transporter permease [Acetoanaerobium noterae]|nr:ABC transporter permease [Acetoanaerobium noterae]